MENLRLKPREATLNPPGISLLHAPSPGEAARQIREAFPAADGLHAAAQVIGSTTVDKIRGVGFDVMPNPTRKLPNHGRMISRVLYLGLMTIKGNEVSDGEPTQKTTENVDLLAS